jgi:hypothetical protein
MKWKVLLLVSCLLMLIVFGTAAAYFEAQIFTHNPQHQRAAITQTPA